mgnify:CR=1 FL=1
MNDQTTSPPSAFQRHLPLLHRVLSSRRCWKALGFTALGLITLLALFYAIENWRGARVWKEVRDQLRAQANSKERDAVCQHPFPKWADETTIRQPCHPVVKMSDAWQDDPCDVN